MLIHLSRAPWLNNSIMSFIVSVSKHWGAAGGCPLWAFTVETACATEGLYSIYIIIIIIFDHPLYDPSTEQLSHLKLLFEPMQLPSFLPVAACVLL